MCCVGEFDQPRQGLPDRLRRHVWYVARQSPGQVPVMEHRPELRSCDRQDRPHVMARPDGAADGPEEYEMKIGIIGAGNIGGNLVQAFRAAGHEVRVANSRGPQTLSDLASRTGATAVDVTQAAEGAQVVVVTIPQKAVPALPAGVLSGAAAGAVVIDTGNYYPQQRDGRIDAIEDGTAESVWVSEQLGHPVVKVFNGIYAAQLLTDGRPADAADRRALPVAGDDADAKRLVTGLLDTIGFDAVDAGPLALSWRQQPGTPVYGAIGDKQEISQLLDKAQPERPAEFSAGR